MHVVPTRSVAGTMLYYAVNLIPTTEDLDPGGSQSGYKIETGRCTYRFVAITSVMLVDKPRVDSSIQHDTGAATDQKSEAHLVLMTWDPAVL